MRLGFGILALLGVVLTLGACEQGTSPRLLSKSEQAALGTVDAIVTASQDRPEVTITPTGASGAGGALGGLVYGVVDGVKTARAQDAAGPIIEAMRGYDFPAELLAATTAKLATLSSVHVVVRPAINKGGDPALARSLYDESKDASVMFFAARPFLGSGNNLVLSAAVVIYPKSAELKQFRPKPNDKNPLDPGNAIYRNWLYVVRPSVTPANVRTNITDAINEVAAQLAVDLERMR